MSVHKKRPLVLPYTHKIAHNLEKVTKRHDVPVVFSAPNRLSKLRAHVSSQKAKLS